MADQMTQNSNDSEEKITGNETALLNDDNKHPEDEDVKTAIEKKKTPRKVEDMIKWDVIDEELRLNHDERLINSQKPSMWEYNPKGGVPSELANLDPSTFLTAPLGPVFCFLPKNVFIRLCSMLSVFDFIHLSMTCRFLHWRMYTFCTCYTPYTVEMWITDKILTKFRSKGGVKPKLIYILNDGVIDDVVDINGSVLPAGLGEAVGIWQYPRELDGQRGHFVYQPFCLRRPFFFETLELDLGLRFYCKKLYNMCLPYILAVRGLVRHLDINLLNEYNIPKNPSYFSDTNDFLMAINASYYCSKLNSAGNDHIYGNSNNLDIYMNCPCARLMKRVDIFRINKPDIINVINVPVFRNTIGIYEYPLDSAIIATLKNFLTDSTNLVFHQYLTIEKHNGRFPLIEYLFQEFGKFEEFLYEIIKNGNCVYCIWNKVIATENGVQLRIMIEKQECESYGHVTIGKEETFDEMNNKYAMDPPFRDGNTWWEMETAVEPSETEAKSDVTVELDVPEALDETEKSGEADKSEADKSICLVDDCKGGDVRREEADEEQESSGACLCLNNISCSIQ